MIAQNEALLSAARQLIARFQLAPADYVITASGPLGVRGERQMADVDMVVSDAAWAKLAAKFKPQLHKGQLKIQPARDIEIFCAASFVNDPPGMPTAQQQLESGETIQGLQFVSLEVCRQLKLCLNRPKDLADIQTLNYLIARQSTNSPLI